MVLSIKWIYFFFLFLSSTLLAFESASLFHLTWITSELDKNYKSQNLPHINNFLVKLAERTSIESSHTPFQLLVANESCESSIFEHPFLVIEGQADFKGFTDQERRLLSDFLLGGGMILIDDTSPVTAVTNPFDQIIRAELKKIVPEYPLETLAMDHAIYRSFYLIQQAVGRYAAYPRLEGIDIEGQPAIIYSRNNLLGSFDLNQPCVPDGEDQREYALRLTVNIVLYLLTSDYKNDQIHLPEILKRTK